MGFVTTGGDPRVPRLLILLAVCVVLYLHLLYLLRDWHDAWKVMPGGGGGAQLAMEEAPATTTGSPTHAPYSAATDRNPFPRKLWQTSKHSTTTLDDASKSHISTWIKLNQDWRYEILTDASAETYVQTTFANRPNLVSTYLALHDPILRADMLRYLVLLGDGGVYSDMDTRALKPIDDWIPREYHGRVNAVVGIEYDRRDGGRWADWTLDLQFTNWAMLSQPGHPLYDLTLTKLVYNLHTLAAKKGQRLSELKPANDEVLDTTGPALFTLAIYELLSERTGFEFSWLNCTKLREPLLVSDVLILPVTSFGNSQSHSDSRPSEDHDALVQHMFRGSWKGGDTGRLAKAEDEKKKKKQEEEKKKKEEEEKKKKEEEEKKKKEEEEKKKNEEEEKRRKEEEDKKKEEEEKKKKAEEERRKKEAEDRKTEQLAREPEENEPDVEESDLDR